MRVVPEIAGLRSADAYHAVREALAVSVNQRSGDRAFRICHVSIQGNHLHLLVEADSTSALSRGMQGFSVSCARRLNAVAGSRDGLAGARRGPVFADRYHAVPLTTPRQVRNTLAYVLNNWRKHGEDAGRRLRLDPFSSAITLPAWTPEPVPTTANDHRLPVWFPTTWLLRIGWQRAGDISPWARPGPS